MGGPSAGDPKVMDVAEFIRFYIRIWAGEEGFRFVAGFQVMEHEIITRLHTNPRDVMLWSHRMGC